MEYRVVEKWIPGFEPKTKLTASGFLDDNGYANFDLKMNSNRQTILTVSQPDNICYGGIQLYYLVHEKNNAVKFDYARCAYSKLIMNNASFYGPNDSLILYQSDDLGELNGTYAWLHQGCVYWETTGGTDGGPIGYSVINEGNIYYKWEVRKIAF